MSLLLKSCVRGRYPSKITGATYWDITWIDTETFHEYTTSVDESYDNFIRNGWDKIVSNPNPYGLYDRMNPSKKVNSKGKTIISADHEPNLIAVVDKSEVNPLIAELVTNELMRRGEL